LIADVGLFYELRAFYGACLFMATLVGDGAGSLRGLAIAAQFPWLRAGRVGLKRFD